MGLPGERMKKGGPCDPPSSLFIKLRGYRADASHGVPIQFPERVNELLREHIGATPK